MIILLYDKGSKLYFLEFFPTVRCIKKIHIIVEAYYLRRFLQFQHWIIIFFSIMYFRKPKGETKKTESFKLQPARQPPTVMPNIKPRPNLHAQHHNLDTLERLVFEDFNATPYTSKSTIVISGWDAILCDWKLIRRKFQFIDPRGYINISWLFVQVS